jgi:hypothetical protein
VKVSLDGARAEGMRWWLAEQSADELVRVLMQDYTPRYPSIVSLGPVQVEDDAAANTLSWTERYAIADWVKYQDGVAQVAFHADSVGRRLNLPREIARKSAYFLGEPTRMQQEIRVEFPVDLHVKPGAAESVRDARFRLDTVQSVQGQVFKRSVDYETLSDRVPPAALAAYAEKIGKARDLLGFELKIPVGSPQKLTALLESEYAQHERSSNRKSETERNYLWGFRRERAFAAGAIESGLLRGKFLARASSSRALSSTASSCASPVKSFSAAPGHALKSARARCGSSACLGSLPERPADHASHNAR